MPLPGRRLTALMTRYNGSSLLIDCGEGTQVAIKEKGWTFKPIDAICFTHYHADHISGLPGLLLTMGNTDRREPLTMIGPKGLERVVNSLRVICPELPFPIVFHEVTAPEEVIEMNGYKITAFRVQHNITCYGYSLEISRKGKFDVERAKAQEIPIKCWNPLQKGETVTLDGKTYTPDMVLGEVRRGLHVTYATDTRPTEMIGWMATEADLAILEGMFAEDAKENRARETCHMTIPEACRIAREANPTRLWLTHYSPSLPNPQDYAAQVTKLYPQAHLARDGETITLRFPDE